MNRALASLRPFLFAALLLAPALGLVACASDPAPAPAPDPLPEGPVTPRVSYAGRIYLDNVAGAGGSLSPRLIKTQAEYERFVSAIPQRKIQKKQPAPPSEDPLLEMPKVDFPREVLIVALRDSMYVHPELGPITAKDGDLEVQVVYPPLGDTVMAAAMHGVGVYAAAVVPACSGEVRFVEDGEPGQREPEPFPR
ncbi:MAG TPA: hypothetical protein DEA08_01890 [Planctomycetes bacterium]|nr:hypothetical protein [Planctomycetota bacterium]